MFEFRNEMKKVKNNDSVRNQDNILSMRISFKLYAFKGNLLFYCKFC